MGRGRALLKRQAGERTRAASSPAAVAAATPILLKRAGPRLPLPCLLVDQRPEHALHVVFGFDVFGQAQQIPALDVLQLVAGV